MPKVLFSSSIILLNAKEYYERTGKGKPLSRKEFSENVSRKTGRKSQARLFPGFLICYVPRPPPHFCVIDAKEIISRMSIAFFFSLEKGMCSED